MSWVNIVRWVNGEAVLINVMPSDDATPDVPLPEHIPEFYCPCRPTVIRDNLFNPAIVSHREPFHPGANTLPDA